MYWIFFSIILRTNVFIKKAVTSFGYKSVADLTSAISASPTHRLVKLLGRTAGGLRGAGRCGWTCWRREQEEGRPPPDPSSGRPGTAPCRRAGWKAAGGTATPWLTAPTPVWRDDYARNSFQLKDGSEIYKVKKKKMKIPLVKTGYESIGVEGVRREVGRRYGVSMDPDTPEITLYIY